MQYQDTHKNTYLCNSLDRFLGNHIHIPHYTHWHTVLDSCKSNCQYNFLNRCCHNP